MARPESDTITGGDGQDTFDYQSGKFANFKDFALYGTGAFSLM